MAWGWMIHDDTTFLPSFDHGTCIPLKVQWLSQAANAIMRPRLLVQSLESQEMAEWLMG
jgi:hypothetical protein